MHRHVQRYKGIRLACKQRMLECADDDREINFRYYHASLASLRLVFLFRRLCNCNWASQDWTTRMHQFDTSDLRKAAYIIDGRLVL